MTVVRLVGGASTAAIVLALTISVIDNLITLRFAIVIAAALFGFGMLILLHERKLAARHAVIVRLLREMQQKQAVGREKVYDIAATTGRTAPLVRDIAVDVAGILATLSGRDSQGRDAASSGAGNPGPRGHGAGAGRDGTSAAVAGRAATPAPPKATGWGQLVRGNIGAPVCRVALIGGGARSVISQHVENVLSLTPGIALEQAQQAAPDLLVIDRSALRDGPWACTEGSAGLHQFGELTQVANWIKSSGARTLVLDAPVPPDVNTASLKELADSVIPYSAEVDEAKATPLVNALNDYVESQFDKRDGHV